ncbi:MAG TPA: hypothetical protein VGG78_03740 [Gemmatimonadaceae bacterium]
MRKLTMVRWRDEPEDDDYPAASSYLTLLYDPATVRSHIRALRRAPRVEYAAKDLLRASALPLLPLTNTHVRRDEKKIVKGLKLSPLLLVRDPDHGRLVIADGYHRLCAVYAFDEDAVIPCKIVG